MHPPPRIASIDAYRGFVMLLMMAEVLAFSEMAQAFPESTVWHLLGVQQSHVQWVGCSLHDLIQPSFSFLVGVALPFSIASRLSRGQSMAHMMRHTLWRALLLILLGVFLRSIDRQQTYWTFEDTLTQIGLGYPFLFLLGFRPVRTQWLVFGAILLAYWAAWAAYPLPPSDYDWTSVRVPPDWPQHFQGFARHWEKNYNLGIAFDQWFLNLFPRENAFSANGGGYLTLSFIPTLATMILGLIAGGWLCTGAPPAKQVQRFIIFGLAGLIIGWALDASGICPIVKRIWTPSWTLFSGGWCFLLLAGFYAIIDWRGWNRWAFPLAVIGMNSIAAYLIAHLFEDFIVSSVQTHFGQSVFATFGTAYVPLLRGATVLIAFWLILQWMHRRRLFLKV